ncbi:MAG: FkbM family methyltransferase [Coleofasciculaceae cyanobacterium SM2_3_26]|nr:FkbM family methyltransferase [Coleofasciculaceae cyanobacterium SM2_3_26]
MSQERDRDIESLEELEQYITLAELLARYGGAAFEEIVRAAPTHRRSPFFQNLAASCHRFLAAYENQNFQPLENGEAYVLHVLSQVLANEENVCLFDVGANEGIWSAIAVKFFPNAAIHAFEIVPETRDILKQRTEAFQDITIVESGLSSEPGAVRIRHFPGANQLTTISAYPHNLDCVEIDASVTTGDIYVRESSISHIHFLKIDVEGAEKEVLKGFEKTFSQKKIDVVQFEYGKVNILMKALLIDFHQFFEERGYLVGKIYPNYVEFRDYNFLHEDFLGYNYLAVRRDYSRLIQALSIPSE